MVSELGHMLILARLHSIERYLCERDGPKAKERLGSYFKRELDRLRELSVKNNKGE